MSRFGPARCARCQSEKDITYHARPNYYEDEQRIIVPFPLCPSCTVARYEQRATFPFPPLPEDLAT